MIITQLDIYDGKMANCCQKSEATTTKKETKTTTKTNKQQQQREEGGEVYSLLYSVFEYPLKWCTYSDLVFFTCHVKLLHSRRMFCVHHTIMQSPTPYNHAKP